MKITSLTGCHTNPRPADYDLLQKIKKVRVLPAAVHVLAEAERKIDTAVGRETGEGRIFHGR